MQTSSGSTSTPTAVVSSDKESDPASAPISLPIYSWKSYNPNAKLLYLRNVDEANREIAKLRPGPIGFDLEWKPTFVRGFPENPVALVQIANDDAILVIQVSAMAEFPSNLQEILENSDFIKAGVAIQNDVKKLYKDYQVSTRSCVDLSLLAKSADNARWKGKYNQPISLARLVEAYWGSTLRKGKTRFSNWEELLTEAQLDYAGNDAHAGFSVLKKLLAIRQTMENVPKEDCYSFDAIGGHILDAAGAQWFARNPAYDPGPPPPPRPPRAPHASHVTLLDSPATSQMLAGSSDATAESGNSIWPAQKKPFHRPPSHSIRGARAPPNANVTIPYDTAAGGHERSPNESHFTSYHIKQARNQQIPGNTNDESVYSMDSGAQTQPSANRSRRKRPRYPQANTPSDRRDQPTT